MERERVLVSRVDYNNDIVGLDLSHEEANFLEWLMVNHEELFNVDSFEIMFVDRISYEKPKFDA